MKSRARSYLFKSQNCILTQTQRRKNYKTISHFIPHTTKLYIKHNVHRFIDLVISSIGYIVLLHAGKRSILGHEE